MVVGLYFLMLKPQMGLPVCFFLLGSRFWWASLGGGAVLSLLAAAPAIHPAGMKDFLERYLARLDAYQILEPNSAGNMTGLRNLVFQAMDISISNTAFILSAALLSFLLGRWFQGRERKDMILAGMLAIAFFLVPLQNYDTMLVFVIVPLLANFSLLAQAVAGLGLLTILRSNNLSAFLGGVDATALEKQSELINSCGLALIAGAVLFELLFQNRRETEV